MPPSELNGLAELRLRIFFRPNGPRRFPLLLLWRDDRELDDPMDDVDPGTVGEFARRDKTGDRRLPAEPSAPIVEE